MVGIPSTCHITHPPGRLGKQHWWWEGDEEDAQQQDEGSCTRAERQPAALGFTSRGPGAVYPPGTTARSAATSR